MSQTRHDDDDSGAELGAMGVIALFGLCIINPPAGIAALATIGGTAGLIQRWRMKKKAQKIAQGMSASDNMLVETAQTYRQDKSAILITHKFPLENDSLIPLWRKGVVKKYVDLKTGEETTLIDVTPF